MLGEVLRLRVYPQPLVVHHDDTVGSRPPPGDLLRADAEMGGPSPVPLGRRRGAAQVPLRHQVRVHVVVGDRAVLVRTCYSVDPESARRVVMAKRPPEPRGLDQQLGPDVTVESVVLGRHDISVDGIGDVCVDMKGGAARRPVA